MIANGVVLPMLYLPPVEYFTALNKYKPGILIERNEHFPKQTYRNRANICSPDGVLALTVPVVKGSKNHTSVKDVKISYEFNWQRLHWMSLQACYRRSAYFEYYEDDFARFYEDKTTYLFDYNEQLFRMLIGMVKLKVDLQFTESYEPVYTDRADYRLVFNAKKASSFEQKPYFQVFEERKGFLKNLSIVDLLFSQGPQIINYL